MLNLLFSLLIFLSVVIILVTVHEFGHFSVAKLFGMKVQRFSVGFGNPLFSVYDRSGTEYALAPIPLGGYVKLLDSREGEIDPSEYPYAFDHRPVYQRLAVLIAGPLFNVLLAIVMFWAVFSVGIVTLKPLVGSVQQGSLAAQAGIQAGDEIIAIDDNKTLNWTAVSFALILRYGDKHGFQMTVKNPQAAKVRTLQVNTANWHLDDLRPNPLLSLGITPFIPTLSSNANSNTPVAAQFIQSVHYPFWQAFLPAVKSTYMLGYFNITVLYKMLIGELSWRSLGGPISILQAAEVAAHQGMVVYLNFLGFLSISIAIVNLLPIPGLDGSQIVYCWIEAVRRKPLSLKVQLLIFRIGFILLLVLLLQVMLNDLVRLVGSK